MASIPTFTLGGEGADLLLVGGKVGKKKGGGEGRVFHSKSLCIWNGRELRKRKVQGVTTREEKRGEGGKGGPSKPFLRIFS